MYTQTHPQTDSEPLHPHQDLPHRDSQADVRVWDPLVRIFHWSLVGFFTLAWVSAEEIDLLHEWSGYAIAALLGFRVLWGLIGTRHARFSDFVSGPASLKAYLSALVKGRPRHYLGHNPAGGAMVILMLATLGLLTLSGLSLAAMEGQGPLAATFFASLPEDPVEEVHEFIANLMLVLIAGHLAGVLVSSLLHRENLVRAMITGRKPRQDTQETTK